MPLGDTAKEMGNLDFLGSHLPPLVGQGTPAPGSGLIFYGTRCFDEPCFCCSGHHEILLMRHTLVTIALLLLAPLRYLSYGGDLHHTSCIPLMYLSTSDSRVIL